LEHGRIRTTEAKAKELRILAEKTITKAIRIHGITAKQRDARTPAEQAKLVHAMRIVGRVVNNREVLYKLFNELAGDLKGRPGGYTRIIKMGPRPGDSAPMALIEIILPEKGKAAA
jgi:large subunit ribosomal protein L17